MNMNYFQKLFLAFSLWLCAQGCICQSALYSAQYSNHATDTTQAAIEDKRFQHNHLSLRGLQIKESLNFGLVFSGAEAVYSHSWYFDNPNVLHVLNTELGLGILATRGIVGASVHLTPLQWQVQWHLSPTFSIGTHTMLEYNYQLYPDLQSGYSYWLSHLSAGISARMRFHIFEQDWCMSAYSSLFGLVSRTPENRNPYFFDLGFVEAVRYLHHDIRLRSVQQYFRARLQLSWLNANTSIGGVSLAYTLDVSVFSAAPSLIMLRHGIQWTF
jgi:hypothetical protein